MRITIDIADSILARSRELARREHRTLRELVEEGLRLVTADREKGRQRSVKPVTFKGKGLSPRFAHASWGRIRAAAYGPEGVLWSS